MLWTEYEQTQYRKRSFSNACHRIEAFPWHLAIPHHFYQLHTSNDRPPDVADADLFWITGADRHSTDQTPDSRAHEGLKE